MTHIWNNQIIICSVLITLPITKGSVFIYYKSNHPLSECINSEVSIANKICRFTKLYRSPSQKQDEFQAFKSNVEKNLDTLSTNNSLLTVMISDFNAKSSNWYLNDITTLRSQIKLCT